MAYSQLKALSKKAAARTVATLWAAIAKAIQKTAAKVTLST
jgi:hypothetical protein